MIEIFNIIIILLINIIFFFTPAYIRISENDKSKYDIFKIRICYNLVFLLNILLIISFIEINFIFLLSCILLVNVIQLILFYKNFHISKDIKYFYLILFFVTLVLSVNLSINLKLEWDASVNWIFKTLNFYNGFAFDNLRNVPGVTAYPHLGSFLWSLFWKISIVNAEYVGRIVFLFLFVFSIILNSYKNNKGFRQNMIVIIILCALFYDESLFAGYQEVLMFSLISILFFFINRIKDYRNINLSYIFFVLLGINLLLWIKNEGLVWSILIVGYIFFTIKTNYKCKTALVIGFIILSISKYFIFLKFFGENLIGWDGYSFLSLDSNFLITVIERFHLILFDVFKVLFKYPFLIVAFIILISNFSKKQNLNLLFFLIINIIISSSIFLFTDNVKWKFHSDVGLDRMIYQTSGFYILLISNSFHQILQKININRNNKK
jgi:hypothetical protein